MKLIGAGKFKNEPDKIDKSLKYVLGLGTVDIIIVGFELPEQIDNYIRPGFAKFLNQVSPFMSV